MFEGDDNIGENHHAVEFTAYYQYNLEHLHPDWWY